jgi:hypothetical protein
LQADQLLREHSFRFGSPPPQRTSVRTLRPFRPTRLRKTLRERSVATLLLGSFSSPPMSRPMRRIRSGCCARATTGHAAALPTPAMNSRRRIRDLLPR